MRKIQLVVWGLALVAACGADSGKGPGGGAGDVAGADAGATTTADATDSGGDVAAHAADASKSPLPNISEALDCGAGPPVGPGNGGELQRFPLDLATFPDAICNVRMALLDQLIPGNYLEAGYSNPDLGELTLAKFAVILQRELSEFPNLPTAAEEGAAMIVAPGVFAPACTQHDTIHDNGEVHQTAITPAGGTPLHLFDVFEAWRVGGSPSAVLTASTTRDDTSCAP
jgi:hypothetical protein